jgi:hypothetical protein
VKTGVIAVSSNEVAGQAKPETVSATPVKAWESTSPGLVIDGKDAKVFKFRFSLHRLKKAVLLHPDYLCL